MNASLQTQTKVTPASPAAISVVPTGLLRRKCACGGSPGADGECAACRNKRLQRLPASQADPASAPRIVHEVLRTPGQSLDPATRAFMEPRFGHDFSRVRVHTDARAAESARAVNALAYTVGPDVVFGAGKYAPTTAGGKHLLAHELAHTIQQGGERASRPATLEISDPAEAAERHVERAAGAALDSRDPGSIPAHAPHVARWPVVMGQARAPAPATPSQADLVIVQLRLSPSDTAIRSTVNINNLLTPLPMKELLATLEEVRSRGSFERLFAFASLVPQDFFHRTRAAIYVVQSSSARQGPEKLEEVQRAVNLISRISAEDKRVVMDYLVRNSSTAEQAGRILEELVVPRDERTGQPITAPKDQGDPIAKRIKAIDTQIWFLRQQLMLPVQPMRGVYLAQLAGLEWQRRQFQSRLPVPRKQEDLDREAVQLAEKQIERKKFWQSLAGLDDSLLEMFSEKKDFRKKLAALDLYWSPAERGFIRMKWVNSQERDVMYNPQAKAIYNKIVWDYDHNRPAEMSWFDDVVGFVCEHTSPCKENMEQYRSDLKSGMSVDEARGRGLFRVGTSFIPSRGPRGPIALGPGGPPGAAPMNVPTFESGNLQSAMGPSGSLTLRGTTPATTGAPWPIWAPTPAPKKPATEPTPESASTKPEVKPTPEPAPTPKTARDPAPKPKTDVIPVTPVRPADQGRRHRCSRAPGQSCPTWHSRLTARHEYWNHAYSYRRDHQMLGRDHFNQNVAVLVLEGETPIIQVNAVGFHSEQLMLWTLLRRGLDSGCPIRGLFSERKPCQQICQKDVLPGLCRINNGVPFDVYFATDYYNSPQGQRSENNRHELIKSYTDAGYF